MFACIHAYICICVLLLDDRRFSKVDKISDTPFPFLCVRACMRTCVYMCACVGIFVHVCT